MIRWGSGRRSAVHRGETDVNAWWRVPIGFAAWLGVSLVVGLWLGPAFKRSSQAREALDPHTEEPCGRRQEPPQDGPHAA